jgi:GNAT superfamily N-acetyltransferase
MKSRNGVILPLAADLVHLVAEGMAPLGKPHSQYKEYLKQQLAGEILCLVASMNGEFAGYLKIVWRPDYPALAEVRVPEIQDLNVVPQHRRCGVASALLDRAESEVRRRSSIVGIGVGLHPGYNAAQRLYVLRGYVPDGKGVTYGDHYVQAGEIVPFDDNLTLHFTKALA